MDEHVVMSVFTGEYCGRTRCDVCVHAGILWRRG